MLQEISVWSTQYKVWKARNKICSMHIVLKACKFTFLDLYQTQGKSWTSILSRKSRPLLTIEPIPLDANCDLMSVEWQTPDVQFPESLWPFRFFGISKVICRDNEAIKDCTQMLDSKVIRSQGYVLLSQIQRLSLKSVWKKNHSRKFCIICRGPFFLRLISGNETLAFRSNNPFWKSATNSSGCWL